MNRLNANPGFLLAIALAVLVGLASATVMLLFADTPAPPYYVVNDLNGANDEPGQKDLTRMGRYDDPAGFLDIFWSWDEGTTGGNTLDACALFDSDGDGNVNYAICGTVGSDFKQVSTSPKAFSCDDSDKFHCLTPIALTPVGDDLAGGTLAGLVSDGNLVTNTDPFGSDIAPNDITLRVRVKKSFLGNSVMTNVCTYPANTNSDYSDCVSNEGGGFLSIVKNTSGGDGNFTFKANPVTDGTGSACSGSDPSTCRSYSLTTVGGTGSVTIGAAANAVMSVSEVIPAGWQLSAPSCVVEGQQGTSGSYDGNSTVSGIPVVSGKFTTCTFTNAKQPAKLTVTKIVTNDNGGGAAVGDFTLKVDNSVVVSGVQNQFPAGDYTVSESGGPSGYAGSIGGACASDGSIHLEPGQTYACTITNNDVAPSLSLTKAVVNDNGGSASATSWTLSATCTTPSTCGLDIISGAGGTSSTSAFKAGTYSLAEAGGPAGYTASAWSCTGGVQNGSNITLAVGQSASCTITNNDQQGTLIVKKIVVNDNGGTRIATDFTFKVGSDSPVAFLQDTDTLHGKNTLSRNAGIYTITEPAVAGYTTTYDNCTNVVLANGGTQTCTITNDDQPGSLIVKKVVVNNNGGTSVATDFSFKVNNEAPVAFAQDTDAAHGKNTLVRDAGTYTITEPAVNGYTVSYDGCSNIALGNGETRTCTITNDDQQGTLVVKKVVVNDNGGTAVASNFSFKVNNGSTVAFAAGGTNNIAVDANTYTVTETPAAGYTVNYSNCSNVSVAIGETETCTITNNDIAPTLTLIKYVDNSTSNDASKDASDFLLSATGTSVSISGAGGATSGPAFQAGTYTLSEANTAGYVGSAWNCAGGIQIGNSITLGVGQAATCSVLNTAVNLTPVIKVDKSASPANLPQSGGTVTFTVTVTNNSGSYDPFTLTSLTDSVYGDLTLLVEPGFKDQQSTTCSLPQTILGNGGSYTCSFTGYFAPIPDNTSFSEHDVVTASGTDDDNAGTSSVGTASDDAFVTMAPPIAVTRGACTFDTNLNRDGRQWTRIFTPDLQNIPYYKFHGTNPGQFFYNVSAFGHPGDHVQVKLTLPWPFVTQGAMPVHLYDSVGVVNSDGTPYDGTRWDFCFVPGNELGPMDSYVVLRADPLPGNTVQYDPAIVPGGTNYVYDAGTQTWHPVTVDVLLNVTIPASGAVFIRQHIDDGLKGPQVDVTGDGVKDSLFYGKGTGDNATNATTGVILIPENTAHVFGVSFTGGSGNVPGTDTIYNDNDFKKNTGVAGRVTDENGDGVEGKVINLYAGTSTSGPIVGAGITDAQGWYLISYKHTGKEAAYTVFLTNPAGATVTTPNPVGVTLKSNGFAEVNFGLDLP